MSVFFFNSFSSFAEAYLRSNPKASEKNIEDKISGTLKGAPFKKGGVLTVVPADISMVMLFNCYIGDKLFNFKAKCGCGSKAA